MQMYDSLRHRTAWKQTDTGLMATISPASMRVLTNLYSRHHKKDNSWPGIDRLAKETGIVDEKELRKAIHELEWVGILTIEKRPGQSQFFRINPLPRSKNVANIKGDLITTDGPHSLCTILQTSVGKKKQNENNNIHRSTPTRWWIGNRRKHNGRNSVYSQKLQPQKH